MKLNTTEKTALTALAITYLSVIATTLWVASGDEAKTIISIAGAGLIGGFIVNASGYKLSRIAIWGGMLALPFVLTNPSTPADRLMMTSVGIIVATAVTLGIMLSITIEIHKSRQQTDLADWRQTNP